MCAFVAHRGFTVDQSLSSFGPDRTTVHIVGRKGDKFLHLFYFDYPLDVARNLRKLSPDTPTRALTVKTYELAARASIERLGEHLQHVCVVQSGPKVANGVVEYVRRLNLKATGGVRFSAFPEHFFAFDLLKHPLVPRQWIERRATFPDEMPVMSLTDPAAEWLGAVAGDVVAAERLTNTRGRYLYYRRVTIL